MRKSPAKTPKPPTRNYAYLKQLDAEGWYAELTRLCKLSVDNDLRLFKGDPNICSLLQTG